MTFLSSSPWIADLPAATIEKITREYPSITGADIQNAYSWYQCWEASFRESPTPQDMRKKLTAYGEAIEALYNRTIEFEGTGLQELLRRYCPIDGDRDAFDNMKEALERARFISQVCIPRALANVKDGRRPTAEQMLAANIGTIVKRAGYAVDAKPNGAITQILSTVLAAAGKAHSDPRKIVGAMLEKAVSLQMDNSQEN